MRNGIEHRCDACGSVVGRGPAAGLAIGRPFAECPRCGASVARPPFAEWPLLPRAARWGYVASRLTFVAALALLPALVLGLVSIATGGGVERGRLLAVAGAGLALGLVIWSARFSGLVRRSRRRMADPMYRARLAEFEMRTSRRPG